MDKGDFAAKSYNYALACINIPLAVYAWATPAACLAAQGVPHPCFANARFVYLCNPSAIKRVFLQWSQLNALFLRSSYLKNFVYIYLSGF